MKRSYALVVAALATVMSLNAHAALRGQPTLPAVAASTTQGVSVDASVNPAYTVRQETLANGLTEREYLTTGGEVFGIAWSGPFQPDLQNFMGSDVFAEYGTALQALHAQGLRGPVNTTFDGVVVQVGGHMGHFVGRAYVVDLVPTGVDPSVIQ
jgi:hypothetical protein